MAANNNNETPEQRVALYFAKQLDSLEKRLATYQLLANTASAGVIQQQFNECRENYKKVEFLMEYLYPAAANRINGAPLLEAEASEPEEPQHPTGFQVLEEPVYDTLTTENRLAIGNEISSIIFQLRKVKTYNHNLELTAPMVFDALRLNIYRLIAKGITGFDCPVALNSVAEARATLISMKDILACYTITDALNSKLEAAISITRQQTNFNTFDRATFISAFLNPLLNELHNFQRAKEIAFIQSPRAVNTNAKDIFQPDAFNVYYFAPSGTEAPSLQLIALGDKLFHDPLLSANGTRSCGSCHEAKKAFTDGLAVNFSILADQQLSRNTPTLINAGLQPVQFADSRIAFLEDQVHAVVSNQQEMGGDFDHILKAVKSNKDYKQLFPAAFNEKTYWTKANIKKALAAYVRSLTALNSRFDQYMRGDKQAMNQDEIKGFNLFMGKGRCGTCHYAPLFSGAVPPLYDKMESEVLGVPATKDTLRPLLDTDKGKYNLYKMPHQLHSFKTPGLRNIALTAPYMHNGVYNALEEVMDFYNKGGGAGLGFNMPNQTLSGDKLDLSKTEQQAIIQFLKTLTDTTITRM